MVDLRKIGLESMQDLGFRICGFGFRELGIGFGGLGIGSGNLGIGLRGLGSVFLGFEYRVYGVCLWFRASC